MTAAVFVDTNVFVYMRDASARAKQSAAESWLRHLWLEQLGRTSIQVLSEFYTTVTRKLDPGLEPDDAWQDVTALLAWEPQAMDGDVLIRGRELQARYGISWWDALIVAAAQIQGCPLLLSEDFQHGMQFGGTTIVNPFTTGVAEARASYSKTTAKPRSRHRPRGRPARTKAAAPEK
jgi:predicted nucleic acid-binding protein